MRAIPINADRVREVLDYDPETGEFRWLVSRGSVRAGSVAGNVSPDGYRNIQIDGQRYLAHRLAWFYMTGRWPAEEVDHDNLIKDDNRWTNLRDATHAQNGRNSSRRRDNTSGVKGVSWHASVGKWQASIRVNTRLIYLGLFNDLDAASAAYAAASARHHGEFGRTE